MFKMSSIYTGKQRFTQADGRVDNPIKIRN